MTGSEGRRAPLERAEAAVAAVVIAVALLGAGLLPLTTPAFVRGLVSAVHAERDTGLPIEQTLDTAESVLRFVTDAGAPALPERVGGRAGFDAFAVSHLIDVRNVLVPARLLAMVLTAASVVWVLVRRRSVRGGRIARAALTGAGGLLVGIGGLVAAAGVLDFDRLFTQFHGLFFDAGTWVFPSDVLLIQVFPLRFWIAAGASWAALVLILAVVALVLGHRFAFTTSRRGV